MLQGQILLRYKMFFTHLRKRFGPFNNQGATN